MTSITTPIYNSPFDGGESRSAENPEVPLNSAIFEDYDGYGLKTTSGVRVSRRKALGYPAIWRAVNLISTKVASVSFDIYKPLPGGGEEIDLQHPAQLLMEAPNEWMGPFDFKQTLLGCALLRGNGYAYIYRDSDGSPLELLPLDPEATYPVRRNGELWYVTTYRGVNYPQETYLRFPACDCIHIKGLSYDGLVGYDVITILRESIGGALATREHKTRFFSNSTRPPIVLEFPPGMKDDVIDKIANRWASMNQGLTNAHRTGILRAGVKLNTIATSARDAQLLENLTFDAVDIANMFGLPPRKVGLDQGGGYNSVYEENQSIYSDNVHPWCMKVAQEKQRKLLTEDEKKARSRSVGFKPDDIGTANPQQQADFYNKAIMSGWMNPDEVRSKRGLNPLPDGAGKQFWRPVNLAPIDQIDVKADPLPSADPPANDSMRAAIRKAIAETAGRMARRLTTHAERAAKKDARAWLSTGVDEHLAAITEAFEPLAEAARQLSPRSLSAAAIAKGLVLTMRAEMGSASDLAAWLAKFPDEMARSIPISALPE